MISRSKGESRCWCVALPCGMTCNALCTTPPPPPHTTRDLFGTRLFCVWSRSAGLSPVRGVGSAHRRLCWAGGGGGGGGRRWRGGGGRRRRGDGCAASKSDFADRGVRQGRAGTTRELSAQG
eukprot:3509917-Rhodomonas_salina.2